MAFDCRAYRILIASPSDVDEEREVAVRVIQEWNDLYSYTRKIVLLPLRWETHTAPEYGTRPQEVINRAIVDQCDLLVGIFWGRIGTPTGVTDSGTLEEIERVGAAEKPIMLYFSRVGVDPEEIDLQQLEKLKQFKKKTYPKGLVENFKTIIEFRDKFAKQLELKVRELQNNDASGESPLSLEFLAIEEGNLVGNKLRHSYVHPEITGIDEVPPEHRERIKELVKDAIKDRSYYPMALGVKNSTSSGIRNLYVELEISSSDSSVEITDTPNIGPPSNWTKFYLTLDWPERRRPNVSRRVESSLARFDADKLQSVDGVWQLSFEWEALQPQRARLIKPVLYIHSPSTAKVSVRAKVFADSFPAPLIVSAELEITVQRSPVKLSEFLPDYEKILEENVLRGTE